MHAAAVTLTATIIAARGLRYLDQAAWGRRCAFSRAGPRCAPAGDGHSRGGASDEVGSGVVGQDAHGFCQQPANRGVYHEPAAVVFGVAADQAGETQSANGGGDVVDMEVGDVSRARSRLSKAP
ncbi:MAG: hypothetical protein ACLP01_20875 [Solirubrobacteraceae bacterium]